MVHRVYVISDILGVAANVQNDKYNDNIEDIDQRDWIMAEAEVQILTEKQKMKSRAVEECENVRRDE